MVDSEMQSDFDVKGLSLIDVTSEDDCLINSPLFDPINPQFSEKGFETKTVRFASIEESGKLDEDKVRTDGTYNLRKSLAWDRAFFTSAGFLEPEQLSSMLGGNEKDEIHTLPGMQQGVNNYCDSETLTLECLEADLFEDISASIQKSNNVSNTANSGAKKELKITESRTVLSSKKLEYTTQDKMKHKSAPKKPNTGVKDSGKTFKLVSARPQSSQSVARSGESTSSLRKPPKGPSRAGPISTTPTKRVFLGAKNVKTEKDAESVTGIRTRVLKTPALGGSRNIVPRPAPFSGKTELTTSCSSLERFASVSSDRTSKSSLNITASKITAKSKSQARRSQLSTLLKSTTKLSSSISLARSNSEWSSHSSSSTSAANKRSNIVRASLGSGSHKGLVTNRDAHQALDSQNHLTGQCSLGDGAEVTGSLDQSVNEVSAGSIGLLQPASIKSTSLRMPSPKIGFFNGARSSGYTPNRSMLSHPGVPIGLPKIGAKSPSPTGSSNKAPVRSLTVIKSPNADVKQTSTTLKSRSSLPIQKSSTAVTKVLSASRNPQNGTGLSPKLQGKTSPRTGRESYSKVNIGSAEKIVVPGLPSQVVSLGGKDGARIRDTKIVPLGVSETTDDLASKSDVQIMITSIEAAENETYSNPLD